MTATMPFCHCGHPNNTHGLGHPCKVPECGCRVYRARPPLLTGDPLPGRLQWAQRHTTCGRFSIQTSRVRGEPAYYSLILTRSDHRRAQALDVETGADGRNAVARVKAAAEFIAAEYHEWDPDEGRVDTESGFP